MSRSPLPSSPPLPPSSKATSPPSYCYCHHWQIRQFRHHYVLIILGTTWLATQVNIWESALALFAKSARWQYHQYHQFDNYHHHRRHFHPHHQHWHQLNHKSHHYCTNWQQHPLMKWKPALSVITNLRILSGLEHLHLSALSSASTICPTVLLGGTLFTYNNFGNNSSNWGR